MPTIKTQEMTVFWDVALSYLVEDYRRFRSYYCRHNHCRRDDGGINSSEMSVNFYETAWRNIPEDSPLG
jgi:hypothetical protein